jgi:hypothetical protein
MILLVIKMLNTSLKFSGFSNQGIAKSDENVYVLVGEIKQGSLNFSGQNQTGPNNTASQLTVSIFRASLASYLNSLPILNLGSGGQKNHLQQATYQITYFCWPNKFLLPVSTSVGPTKVTNYFFHRSLFPTRSFVRAQAHGASQGSRRRSSPREPSLHPGAPGWLLLPRTSWPLPRRDGALRLPSWRSFHSLPCGRSSLAA